MLDSLQFGRYFVMRFVNCVISSYFKCFIVSCWRHKALFLTLKFSFTSASAGHLKLEYSTCNHSFFQWGASWVSSGGWGACVRRGSEGTGGPTPPTSPRDCPPPHTSSPHQGPPLRGEGDLEGGSLPGFKLKNILIDFLMLSREHLPCYETWQMLHSFLLPASL